MQLKRHRVQHYINKKASLREIPDDLADCVFSCEQCPKRFPSQTYLSNHVKTVHAQLRHKCPEAGCQRDFRSKKQLKEHCVESHSGFEPENCPHEGCSFRGYRHHIKNHERRVHIAVAAFECRTCGRRFKAQRKLDDHVRTHTGERPFG